jgi:valyl-tRNA synthetase
MSKGRLRDEAARPLAQRVLAGVLDGILRLVHPVMPFVAESIWQALAEAAFERGLPAPEPSAESVTIAPWPELPASWRDAAMETRIARMQELVHVVRDVRNRYTLDARTPLSVTVRCTDAVADDFRTLAPFITSLAGVGALACGRDVTKPRQAATHVNPEFEVWLSLEGLIDTTAEIQRLEKQVAEKLKHLQASRAKLDNAGFIGRAPAEVVQQQRELVGDLQEQIRALQNSIAELRQG